LGGQRDAEREDEDDANTACLFHRRADSPSSMSRSRPSLQTTPELITGLNAIPCYEWLSVVVHTPAAAE
jgi:hypothetical protein